MRYQLIKDSLNDINNPVETVFRNRGIDNYKEYMNITDDVLHNYSLLDNMETAVGCLLSHLNENHHIHIVVDCDADGFTSASALYNYIKLAYSDAIITYSIHQNKEHGLSKEVMKEVKSFNGDVKLLILPDAGSNDVDECKELSGIMDILILDHHICDKKNPYAIIVNNQNCNYPNKNISGVGIVYKFLQALDEERWDTTADNFIDLVALGNIADNMNLTEYETKRLVDKGLNKIRNKFFKALIAKQEYTIKNVVNIINVQFYIIPLINGMIRSGDYDEKNLMFRAFIETDEVFKYKKRGETDEVDEDIYTRCARLCANAKSRQNLSKDKSIVKIVEEIEKRGYDKNKIIFCNVTDILDETMTGVTAMKIAEQYNRPCILLRKKRERTLVNHIDKITGEKSLVTLDEVLYGGSGRNIDNSPILSLKDFLDGLNVFKMVSGHDNAFGVEISKDKIPLAIDLINEHLADVDFSSIYDVDFIVDYEEFDVSFITNLENLRNYYGTGFKEPYVVIEDMVLSKDMVKFIGKESNTLQIKDFSGITYIKFKIDDDDPIKTWLETPWDDNGESDIVLTIVGRCGLNNFNGLLTPQVTILNYNVRK